MSERYKLQRDPFVVPTADNKVIREHFGRASTRDDDYSIAHMIAPPHWAEPYQTPEFDEVTLVVRGAKQIIIDDKKLILSAGDSIRIKAGVRIQYSNPHDEECEYVSICYPAFSIDRVHRED